MSALEPRRSPWYSRRSFLGGAAALISLPFLESMAPRAARAQAAGAPKRLLFYWIPNGINGSTRAAFWPTATGTDYALTPMLMPLAAHKADFSFVTGLENAPAKPDGAGDHASGTGSFITCAHANKSESAIQLGISADQVAAKAVGKATRLASLQLGMEGGSAAGNCDNGYSCAYARNISWSSATTPVPKITNPGQVFDQLFQGVDAQASAAEQAKRREYETSVLDSAVADANSLMPKLSASDKLKLSEYLEGIREVERQISGGAGSTCEQGTRPSSGQDFTTNVKTMNTLMVLAMRCDATRIITFMLGNAISGRVYSQFAGVTRGHHDLSHHGRDATVLAQLQQIGTYQMELFADLLAKMKAVPEGANDLLYNSAVFISSDVSDGDRHNHDDMPVLLAGHGGGALSPGKHVLYPAASKTKVSNLLYTMLGSAGVDPALSVGDSTGKLLEL